MFPSNLIEIIEHSDERMVVRTKRLYAFLWSLLMPVMYIILFSVLLLPPLLSRDGLGRSDWPLLILATIFIPLGFVYSFFICRKLNVITLDRKTEKILVRPYFRLPFMRPPASYDLQEVRMLFFGRALQWQQCLYVILNDGTCIPILDGNGHFNLTVLREAGRLHEEIAGFIGIPYVNAFAGKSPFGFRKS